MGKDINIEINSKEIIITGLDFSLKEKLKILLTNSNTKFIFKKNKIIYNGKELKSMN